MGIGELSGPERTKLSEAIFSACPTFQDFEDVLVGHLDDTIAKYSGPGTAYPTIRSNVILRYNAQWRIDELIEALLEYAPLNGNVVELAWKHNIAYHPIGATAELRSESDRLERMLDPIRGFKDVGDLLNRLGEIIGAVCRITIPTAAGTAYGTGFLIGEKTVLTNWHIAEHINSGNRERVALLFDYRTQDGEIGQGVTYTLLDDDKEWLIDHSPYDAQDLAPAELDKAIQSTRPGNALDYAVLRVAPPQQNAAEKGNPIQKRAALALGKASVEIGNDFAARDAAVFIFQHPFQDGKSLPLQMDWEKPAVLGINKDQTRAFYHVNTRKGSSGSPCFNARLELIGLHHTGAEDWPADKKYLYNQGIPIQTIIQRLKRRGNGIWERIC